MCSLWIQGWSIPNYLHNYCCSQNEVPKCGQLERLVGRFGFATLSFVTFQPEDDFQLERVVPAVATQHLAQRAVLVLNDFSSFDLCLSVLLVMFLLLKILFPRSASPVRFRLTC